MMIFSGCPFGKNSGIKDDLATMCHAASTVEKEANGIKLTRDQAMDQFNTKLATSKAKSKWGKIFFSAYSSMVGEGKYEVARESAAEEGFKDWRCASMERLFGVK